MRASDLMANQGPRRHPDGTLLTYDEKRAEPVRCVYCPREVSEPHVCQRAGKCLGNRCAI